MRGPRLCRGLSCSIVFRRKNSQDRDERSHMKGNSHRPIKCNLRHRAGTRRPASRDHLPSSRVETHHPPRDRDTALERHNVPGPRSPAARKVKYRDLKETAQKAKEAALLTPAAESTTTAYLRVAEHDSNLALAGLRIEIEKRLRKSPKQRNRRPPTEYDSIPT